MYYECFAEIPVGKYGCGIRHRTRRTAQRHTQKLTRANPWFRFVVEVFQPPFIPGARSV